MDLFRAPVSHKGAESRDQLVENAREQRQSRHRLRIESTAALKIQAFWRGRHVSQKTTEDHFQQVKAKLTDIQNLTHLFQSKGRSFVTPVAAFRSLCSEILFVTRRLRWNGVHVQPGDFDQHTFNILVKFFLIAYRGTLSEAKETNWLYQLHMETDLTWIKVLIRLCLVIIIHDIYTRRYRDQYTLFKGRKRQIDSLIHSDYHGGATHLAIVLLARIVVYPVPNANEDPDGSSECRKQVHSWFMNDLKIFRLFRWLLGISVLFEKELLDDSVQAATNLPRQMFGPLLRDQIALYIALCARSEWVNSCTFTPSIDMLENPDVASNKVPAIMLQKSQKFLMASQSMVSEISLLFFIPAIVRYHVLACKIHSTSHTSLSIVQPFHNAKFTKEIFQYLIIASKSSPYGDMAMKFSEFLQPPAHVPWLNFTDKAPSYGAVPAVKLLDSWPMSTFVVGNMIDSFGNQWLSQLSIDPITNSVSHADIRSVMLAFLRSLCILLPTVPDTLWVSRSPFILLQTKQTHQAIRLPNAVSKQLTQLTTDAWTRSIGRFAIAFDLLSLKNPRRKALHDAAQGTIHHAIDALELSDDENDTEEIPRRGWLEMLGLRRNVISADTGTTTHNANSNNANSVGNWLRNSRFGRWLNRTTRHRYDEHIALSNRNGRLNGNRTRSGDTNISNRNVTSSDRSVHHPVGIGDSLIETSADARAAALSGNISVQARHHEENITDSPHPTKTPLDKDLANACIDVWAILLSRTYSSDAKHGKLSRSSNGGIFDMYALLNTLAFSPSLQVVRQLWAIFIEEVDVDAFLRRDIFSACWWPRGAHSLLIVFCAAFSQLLKVLDDVELYDKAQPLPLTELQIVIQTTKRILAKAFGFESSRLSSADQNLLNAEPTQYWYTFEDFAVDMLRELYERHCQRKLAKRSTWRIDVRNDDMIAHRLVPVIPFVIPFSKRLQMYNTMRESVKHRNQDYVGAPAHLVIHRNNLFESAYRELKRLTPYDLKRRVNVHFINEHGVREEGIDAGGLFKELWTQLSAIIFDANYGLFKETTQRLLYPNPNAATILGTDDIPLFEMVGVVLGKALYEGMVVQPQFAHFFLAKLLNKPVHLQHLPSLDPELYKNLMFLKNYEGDIADLCLTFTIPTDDNGIAGPSQETNLVRNGANKEVTNSNKLLYIHLVANARLNVVIKRQTDAFKKGLYSMIPPQWLSVFSEPELQVLISGSQRGINIDDLKQHTNYRAGYFAAHKVIRWFWDVVANFDERQKAALLQFVTACPRAPPLGFQELEPKFSITKIASNQRSSPLPTSSTCFNILKLPTYSSKSELREKLLTAIFSGSGFETE